MLFPPDVYHVMVRYGGPRTSSGWFCDKSLDLELVTVRRLHPSSPVGPYHIQLFSDLPVALVAPGSLSSDPCGPVATVCPGPPLILLFNPRNYRYGLGQRPGRVGFLPEFHPLGDDPWLLISNSLQHRVPPVELHPVQHRVLPDVGEPWVGLGVHLVGISRGSQHVSHGSVKRRYVN